MNNVLKYVTLGALGLAMALPSAALANHTNRRRQQTKNTWRNLAIGSAAVGVYGALRGDRNLTALGLGGAAYSGYRYEQDRKSQNRDRYGRYGYGYGNRYGNQYGGPYGNRYGNQYGNRYGNQYGGRYGNRYENRKDRREDRDDRREDRQDRGRGRGRGHEKH